MNPAHFDRLTRLAHTVSSRRDLVRGLAAASALAAIDTSGRSEARAGSKKRQKIKRNGFGCVNVGGACRGRDSVCCSGICQGKKPKKGDPDKSRCAAHHEGICTAAHRGCSDDVPPTPCNPDLPTAYCYRTTGQAGFCADDVIPGCIPCRKDADCRQQLGQGAACVVCPSCPNGAEAMCVLPGIE